jgi:hypothetical protein
MNLFNEVIKENKTISNSTWWINEEVIKSDPYSLPLHEVKKNIT